MDGIKGGCSHCFAKACNRAKHAYWAAPSETLMIKHWRGVPGVFDRNAS